jgi:hypothetical protein
LGLVLIQTSTKTRNFTSKMNSRLLLRITIIIFFFGCFHQADAQCITGNCQTGEGTYIYSDNTSYTGDFKDSLAHGYGMCQYSNGNKYVGHWKAHNFHGEGTFYESKGRIVKAIWEEGKLIKILNISYKEMPKVWAVIVGVASYNHMRRLQFTDDDAYKLFAFLQSPEGGALPDEQVKVLIDESATKDNIVKNLKMMFSKADEDDVVLFYFSGHGKEDSFLPYDYDGIDNKLSFNEVNTILSLSKAKNRICIADACHSGGLIASKGAGFRPDMARDEVFGFIDSPIQIAVMVSSQAGEKSMESSKLRQGTFSHFLIQGLKGNADRNRDNLVNISELFNYVNRQVKSYTQNYQNPALFGKYDPEMPISEVRGAGRIRFKASLTGLTGISKVDVIK